MGLRSTYRRCRFCQKKIIFSHEAHFDLSGFVNKQNCRIWCGFWSRGITGPFFFENEKEEAVTVNGDGMLNEFLFTKFTEEDIGNIWFQHDGATCHTAEATLDVLRRHSQPQSCCRLATLELLFDAVGLLFAVRDKCYADKPETIDVVADNIREAIDEIQLHTINNMLKN